MGIIGWIVLGLIAGVLARLLMPGRDPMGWVMTIILGIAGAVLGGFIANIFGLAGVNDLNIWSVILAIGGAMLLLALWHALGRGGRYHPV